MFRGLGHCQGDSRGFWKFKKRFGRCKIVIEISVSDVFSSIYGF